MTLSDGLRGAALLARGRGEGVAHFTGDPVEARRSFIAAPVCLLFFALTRAIDWQVSGAPPHLLRSCLLEFFAFVIGWAGFALLAHAMLGRVGAGRRWTLYIVAWNWCNVVSYAVVLLAALPDLFNAPAMIGEALGLILFGWSIWLEWYAAMLTLDRDRGLATVLVLVDACFSIFLQVLVAVLA